MRSKPLILLLALFLAIPAIARGSLAFEYGPRPPLSVFDPDQILDPARVKEISDPLAGNLREEGIDVIVVVLKEIGSAPPGHVARQFADAWSKPQIHCVVLHVPGNPDSPWILPGGQVVGLINPAVAEREIADRQRRARAEPDDFHKVKAAAEESADLLRFWMGGAIQRSEIIRTESTKMRLELDTSSRRKQILVLAALASILPLAAGFGLLMRVLGRRGPGHFPNHVWQLRLGAPHSGGNHAIASLGPPFRKK